MFNKILLPVDGLSTSNQTIEKAIAMAEAFKSQVTVVCVIDDHAFTGVGIDFDYGQTEYLIAATAAANATLDAVKQLFEARGIPVASSLVEGHAVYKGILDAAQATGADLIVMGSHGRHGLKKLVLGSVAEQVLSHAHLPVMIVRE